MLLNRGVLNSVSVCTSRGEGGELEGSSFPMGMLCMPGSDSPQHLPSTPTDVLPSLWAGTEFPQEFPPGMFVGVRGL